MFTSEIIAGCSVTPKTEDAGKMLSLFPKNEEGLKSIRDLSSMFTVTEVDYCKLLEVPAAADDLRLALERIALAVNTGNPLEVAQAFKEFDGALDAACNPIREKHGVSNRYSFNVITRTWTRRETAKRAPANGEVVTVGEELPAKKLYHLFAGSDGFTAESTNGGTLYKDVRSHYEPTWKKPTEHTDFKHTAIPFFAKHGNYSAEVK